MSYHVRCVCVLVVWSLGALSCQNKAKPTAKPGELTSPEVVQTPLKRFVTTYGPDSVLWADANGMYVSDAEGNLKEKISDKGADWCALDHRMGLLWFERGDEIYAWDLESPASLSVPKPIVSFGDEDQHVPLIIKHIDDQRWLQPRHHQYQLALEIDLAAQPPRAVTSVGCSGDMSWFCYENNGEDEDEERLTEELAQSKASLDALSIQNASWLGQLATRAKGRAQYKAAPAQKEPPSLELDRAPCDDDPEECGKALALPGMPYWAVVTENTRGDFYYESWQLYDPKTKQFFTPPYGPQKPGQAKPLSEVDLKMRAISPSGLAYFHSDVLVNLSKGPVLEHVALCGFLAPGYEPPERLR